MNNEKLSLILFSFICQLISNTIADNNKMHLNLYSLIKLISFLCVMFSFVEINFNGLAANQIKHTQHPGFPKRDEILIDPR